MANPNSVPTVAEFLNDATQRRIHYRVARLGRKFALSREDLEDFWTADGDVVCARYGSPRWWAEPQTAFHLGLWRTRREVLEACGPPWAVDGEPGCLCASLARRFRAAGFTITVAGSVLHHRSACPAEVAAAPPPRFQEPGANSRFPWLL